MSDRPDKCQYCECAGVASDHNHARRFLCGTVWNIEHQSWECCINCARRCVVPLMELRKRVAKAIEATQQANRFDLVAGRHGGIDAESDSAGCYAWASVLDDIAAILQGNSPEIPEGSEGST